MYWIYSPVSQIEDITAYSHTKKDMPPNIMSASNSSSNNSKKKQEEKNIKILREFLALPCNKTCFDCNQRGPTYVNTTIGSFTCISCSGKLRGLTPPHRVKSVTMASFTAEEIEFLKSRGNEYCRLVWMSHYNLADLASETKDEQKFKDHLVAKYEKKRWYADPGTIADRLPVMTKVTNGETTSHQHLHSQQSLAAAAPVVALTNSPVARPSVPSSIASSSPSMSAKSSDLLADLDFFTGAPAAPVPVSTAFSPPRKMHSSMPHSISQPSFANFQNADFFFPEISPQKSNGSHQPLQSAPFNGVMGPSVISPPKEPVANATSEDRYSALKDLDAIFTTATSAIHTAATPNEPQAATQSATANWTPSWNPTAVLQAPAAALITSTESAFASSLESTPSGAWGSAFNQLASAAPPMTSTASITSSSNPFLVPVAQVNGTQSAQQIVGSHGRPSHALPWANFSTSPSSNGSATAASGLNGLHHFATMGAPIGLTSSQSLDLSPKTWATAAGGTASVAMSANPFMQEPASFTQGRSRNPFL